MLPRGDAPGGPSSSRPGRSFWPNSSRARLFLHTCLMGLEGWSPSTATVRTARWPVRPLGQGQEPEPSGVQPGHGCVWLSRDPDQHQAFRAANDRGMAFDPRQISILELAGIITIILSAVLLPSWHKLYIGKSACPNASCAGCVGWLIVHHHRIATRLTSVTERDFALQPDLGSGLVSEIGFRIAVFSLGALTILLTSITVFID